MPVKYSDYRKNTDEILEERRKIAEYNKQFPEETKVKKDTTLGGTLGYLLGKFGAGATSGYEGIADFIAPALKATGKITSSLVDNPVGEFIFGKDAGDPENNPIYQLGESMIRDEVGKTFSGVVDEEFGNRSAFDDNSLATKIASGAGRITAAGTFGKMAGPAIQIKNIDSTSKAATALNNIINQVNNPSMQGFLMDIFGSSYADAINNGASDEEAGMFAIVDTLKEGGIEMISGGIGGIFGKGAVDDYVTDFLVKRAKTKLGQMGLKTLTSMVGEGLEEVLAELITPFTNYIYKHELDFSGYNDLFDNFLVGALTSGVLQGGRALYGKVLDPSTTVYDQIMGEYVDELTSELDTYTNAQTEILNAIDSSQDASEIIELNDANNAVEAELEIIREQLDRINQNSSQNDAPDVLKIIPDTEEMSRVDDKTIASEYKANSIKTIDNIKLNDTEYEIKDIVEDIDNNIVHKQLSMVNKETKLPEGYLKYQMYNNGEAHVEYIQTFDDFQGKGIGRQLMTSLQNVVGDNEIYFDTLTDDGKKFLPKVANMAEYKKGNMGVSYYKGRVKGVEKKSAPAAKKKTTKTVSEKKERGTVTKDQIKSIHTLLGKNSKLKGELYKEFGIKSSTELSKEDASKMIDILNGTNTMSDKIESVSERDIQKVDLQNITAGTEIKGVANNKILDKIDDLSNKKVNRLSEDYLLQKLIDSGYSIDKLADLISKVNKNAGTRLRVANDLRFSALTIAFNQEVEAQVNYKTGEKIGKSINDILKPFEKNKTIDELEAYVYIKSNIERREYGKDNKGIELTNEQQKEFISRMDSLHPEYKVAQKEINKFYRNLLYNEVGGRVDQELADYLTEKYQDYARFYNKNANGIYIKGDKIMVAKAVKQAEGGKYELSSLRESMVRANKASVSGVLDNNLRLELLNCLGGIQLKITEKYQPILNTDQGWMIVAYKNGVPYGIKVTKGIIDGLQYPGITETEEALAKYLKIPKAIGEARRQILTDLNPFFTLWRNPWRDLGDLVVNSKHTTKTLANIPRAFLDIAFNGEITQRYKALGGFSASYYDFTGKKHVGLLARITRLNQIIEQTPRVAEFMASLQSGATVQEALYDAAEVTTNFKRGGVWTKALNRNGFTFLNASVQGMYKQYRNLKGANGIKGYVNLLTKTVGAGIASAIFNNLLHGDDDEYQNLPDYIKDNYYLIKTDKGYVKIPKGRVISIFDKAARNVNDIIKGTDNQFHGLKLLGFAYEQTGPNNPINENILAPIFQAINNEKWTGDPIDNVYETDKSGNSYKLPKDRVAKNTTSVAKFLSSLIPASFNISPKKIDYIMDQYGGFYYDILIKPGITETEEYKDILDNPLMSNVLLDTVYSNKNISEVFDLVGPMKLEADKNKDDIDAQMRYKYVNSQLYQIRSLYSEARKYVVANPHNNGAKVKEITKQINEIANETVNHYKNIKTESIMYNDKEYFMMDGIAYRYDKNGTLRKCTSKVCKEVLNSK